MAARGLGRGLEAMIPKTAEVEAKKPAAEAAEVTSGEAITKLKLSKVEPNRDQPRKNFDEDALEELSENIKQFGVIVPIIVQDRKDHYEIIAGERRWRAARMAGLKEIPAIIKHYTEREIAEIALIDNIQRENLNPIEQALAFKKLIDDFNYKQDELAERVSKSRSAITNALRLLKLGEEVQRMIVEEKLTTGHARALLAIEDQDAQYALAERVFDEKLSVRDVEKHVKEYSKPKTPKDKKNNNSEFDVFYNDVAEKLKASLGTKVSVSGKGDGTGKIEIEFYSNDELDRLVARMK